jgi:hypothetical protein
VYSNIRRSLDAIFSGLLPLIQKPSLETGKMNLDLKAWVSPSVHVYYWQYLCSILQEPSFFTETVKNLDLWQAGKRQEHMLRFTYSGDIDNRGCLTAI